MLLKINFISFPYFNNNEYAFYLGIQMNWTTNVIEKNDSNQLT